MPDFIDRVQEAVQADTDAAVARVTAPRVGLTHCDECGAEISEYRQALGARLCIPHTEEAEARAKQYARQGRR